MSFNQYKSHAIQHVFSQFPPQNIENSNENQNYCENK